MRHWVWFGLALFGIPSIVTAAPAGKSASKLAPSQTLDLGSVTAAVPGSWVSQPPTGQFRLAQYAVPRDAGDTATALFIVFHFGKGGGGSVEDNIKRWIGMMQQPDGKDTSAVAKRARVERTGLRITTLDVPGTYLERPFPMSEQVTPRPNYRMLAAVIETTKPEGEGPYFVRLVGPAKSVGAAKVGWDSFIASVKARRSGDEDHPD